MKAKEADESFHPGSRFGNGNAAFPWPTLVIEIGNAQSLAKLREDVRWWFENSEGDVRIVLLMIVHQRSRTITLEKWQLAPPNTPPLTRASINAFRQAVPPTMPPLVRQIALMLPFHALLDSAPVPPQSDLVFTQAELVLMAQRTWRYFLSTLSISSFIYICGSSRFVVLIGSGSGNRVWNSQNYYYNHHGYSYYCLFQLTRPLTPAPPRSQH
ncbi:hypothetical protein DTO280E4_1485 [Paecilomyces variotii]|nr:hypothetical protein DTO280E4_1485 [Paecilomyces variotii]